MNFVKAAAALILLSCLAAGCTNPQNGQQSSEVPFNPGDRQGDVSLYRDIQFEDIPVPAGYQLLRDQSYSFQGSRFRTGMFYYDGPQDWREVSIFYRNQMPLTGWRQTTKETGVDYTMIKFTKGPEQAVIVIRPLSRGSRVELQLDDVAKNDLLLRGKIKSKN